MVMKLPKIKWEIFTAEDQAKIKELVELSKHDLIAAAISIDTKEKEYEIQSLLNDIRVDNYPFESKVRREMEEIRMRGEEPIESPEDEAKWQKRLDDEYKEHLKQVEKMNKKAINNLKKTYPALVDRVESDTEEPVGPVLKENNTDEVKKPEVDDAVIKEEKEVKEAKKDKPVKKKKDKKITK